MFVKDVYVFDPNGKCNILVSMEAVNKTFVPVSVAIYLARLNKAEQQKPTVRLWNHIIDSDTDMCNINWSGNDTLSMMYESMMFSDKKSKYIPREVLNGVVYAEN